SREDSLDSLFISVLKKVGSLIRQRSHTSEVSHTEAHYHGGLTQDEKMEIGKLLSKYWLSVWVDDQPLPDGSQDIDLRNWRLTVYGLLGLTQSWLLISWFGKDIDVVDIEIPLNFDEWIACLLQVLSTIIIISVTNPVFIAATIPIGLIYLFIQFKKYMIHLHSKLLEMSTTARCFHLGGPNVSDLETKIVSVERIDEFSVLPSEAPWEIEDQKPSKQWPAEGKVSFHNYSTRYREGLDLVLKDINLNIQSAEKIGVVGRTGAGKSSLTLSLFRIIEAAFGSVYIDGHDISTIGLHDLRSKLTVIPQDPVLFTGTLRINLDPSKEFTDEQLWSVLEHAHLKPYVISLSEGLEHHVAEGGENLRKTTKKRNIKFQLKSSKRFMKQRSEFSSLQTWIFLITLISNCDFYSYVRVIVMDQGKIIETGPPKNLLVQTQSVFYGMAKDAGLA
ncbi:multidrug resistance-associated protein 1-like, partial [Limulus polyphemus]|uniref:Multidrug resistance-associated protein 1-like n=1 Tax=Limulus polyphemus TaxID=6850 RepID=A0ABM1TPJ9_LIMPO